MSASGGGGSGGGGLKFIYEAHAGSTSTLTPNIDGNVPAGITTIKDSPPSSPGSEAGSQRKRGRKAKDSLNTTAANIITNPNIANDLKDIKVFQNGAPSLSATAAASTTSIAAVSAAAAVSSLASATTTTTPTTICVASAHHMLGNQINPNSSVAQKLSDQLSMEIQDHSAYSSDVVAQQFVGVPFHGKMVSFVIVFIFFFFLLFIIYLI